MKTIEEPPVETLVMNATQARRVLGVGETTFKRLVRAKLIRQLPFGEFYARAELVAFVEKQREAAWREEQ